MSDVPVLTFTAEAIFVPPGRLDPVKAQITTFYVTIVYPDGNEDRHALGLDYDDAIEKFLAMVESHRYSFN